MTSATRLHILVITGIFPPDIGGPATYVPQIAEALVDRGHQVAVLTLSDRLDHDDEWYPFRLIRLSRLAFKPWRWLRTIAKIIRLGQKAHVLFVNGLFMEATLANLWLRKPIVQKVVGDLAWEQATNRGWIRDGFEDFQKKRYGFKVMLLKAFRAWWTRSADRVIVPSRYLARWVVQWGVPEERIVVIYNTLEPISCVQPTELPLQTPVRVVTVGRLVPWKGVDKVLKAVAQCDGVGVVIVGDGPERRRLAELVRALGLADRVYFAGQRGKAETLALMAMCDIFVLNSSYEGFSHVVLEAMSLGLPVVATAVGGTPEAVQDGENGRLIAPTGSGALPEVLLRLVSSPSERQRLAAGAQHKVKHLSLRQMVEETEAVLWKSVNIRGAQ